MEDFLLSINSFKKVKLVFCKPSLYHVLANLGFGSELIEKGRRLNNFITLK